MAPSKSMRLKFFMEVIKTLFSIFFVILFFFGILTWFVQQGFIKPSSFSYNFVLSMAILCGCFIFLAKVEEYRLKLASE